MLELRGIKKQYHTQVVLQIPLLQLNNNIYWVKGPNGSGKTTLLKMVAGLLPFEGDIFLNGIGLKQKPTLYRQLVGWSEAEPLYPAFMNGKDIIGLYQKIYKTPQKEINTLIERFDAHDYLKSPVGTYSAGMTKKLSLILAFLGRASLVVLDEPLITLDSAAVDSVSALIVEKHKMEGVCFLISSHQELDVDLTFFGKELIINNQTVGVK